MPAMKPNLVFPGVEKLPGPARDVLEFFFPQGEIINPPSSMGVGAMGIVKAIPKGAMPSEVSELSGRGALKEALKIIKDYSTDMDPLKAALTQRATPAKVYHRAPINIPKGFELPKEFGPNYTPRSKSMIDTFVAQRAAPFPEPRIAYTKADPRNSNRFKATTKLTDDQVRAIREMLANDPKSADKIAEQYGVHRNTILNAAQGGYKWVK